MARGKPDTFAPDDNRTLLRFAPTLYWLSLACGFVGAVLPGASWLKRTAPPVFPESAAFVPALCLIILIWAAVSPRAVSGRAQLRKALRVALIAGLIGVLMLVLYMFLLDYTTAAPPPEFASEGRLQIGFWDQSWSTTEKAKKLAADFSDRAPTEWPLLIGKFNSAGAKMLWRPWSILLAGISLVSAFLCGAVLWTSACALLVRVFGSLKRTPKLAKVQATSSEVKSDAAGGVRVPD